MFKSRLQNSVSLSTAKAEYVALSLCVQEVLWAKNLLLEIKIKIDNPVIVHEDNKNANSIAKNEGYQSRAKHIDIRYYFVRDQVKNKVIQLEYIETKLQLAKFLTKTISTKKFQVLVAKSNIKNFSVEEEY